MRPGLVFLRSWVDLCRTITGARAQKPGGVTDLQRAILQYQLVAHGQFCPYGVEKGHRVSRPNPPEVAV